MYLKVAAFPERDFCANHWRPVLTPRAGAEFLAALKRPIPSLSPA